MKTGRGRNDTDYKRLSHYLMRLMVCRIPMVQYYGRSGFITGARNDVTQQVERLGFSR